MAEAIDTSIYKLSNLQDPEENYQKALTDAMTRRAEGVKLSALAMDTQQKQQSMQDQQAQRQAMQQNVDTTGQLDKPAAIQQMYKTAPMQAMAFEKMLNQHGIDGAAQHAERMQQFYANATPESYAKDRQGLIDSGFEEAKQLPEQYQPRVQQRGLMATATAAQQMDMIKNQASMQNARDLKMIEEGIVPPEHDQNLYNVYGSMKSSGQEENPHVIPSNRLPPQAQGLQPGATIPIGKRDIEAQKVYDDALGARKQNDPAYATAGANLLAVKNAQSIFNKYKDLNKINTLDANILSGEAAKIIKGGASPTEQEKDDLSPNNVMSGTSKLWSKISSGPVPTNNGEYYQTLKDYFNDLKENSMGTIKAAHDYAAETAKARGISPQSLALKQRAADKELHDLANGQQQKKAAFDQDVMDYAKTHKITPEQAQQIKAQRTGSAK